MGFLKNVVRCTFRDSYHTHTHLHTHTPTHTHRLVQVVLLPSLAYDFIGSPTLLSDPELHMAYIYVPPLIDCDINPMTPWGILTIGCLPLLSQTNKQAT